MGLQADKLPVLELFDSIQGEGRNIGVPYVFLRVGGCPLRCINCDTQYSWLVKKEQIQDLANVIVDTIDLASKKAIQWVSITGGEPMLYPEQLKEIMYSLNKQGRKTHIETSGRYWDDKVHGMSDIWSVDAKTPCTGEHREDDLHWITKLRRSDQVKCLIDNEVDLDYALHVNRLLDGRCPMVLQPFNHLDSVNKIERGVKMIRSYQWMVESVMKDIEEWKCIKMTPQLHVMLWGNTPRT